MTNDNIKINRALGSTALDAASELTPISLREAKHVMGGNNGMSDESILTMILDHTAVARAFFRDIPKYQLLKYSDR